MRRSARIVNNNTSNLSRGNLVLNEDDIEHLNRRRNTNENTQEERTINVNGIYLSDEEFRYMMNRQNRRETEVINNINNPQNTIARQPSAFINQDLLNRLPPPPARQPRPSMFINQDLLNRLPPARLRRTTNLQTHDIDSPASSTGTLNTPASSTGTQNSPASSNGTPNFAPPTRMNFDESEYSEHVNETERPPSDYEEDSDSFESMSSDSESINENEANVKHCINDNLITLDNYEESDNPIMIYVLNSINKFEKAVCTTSDEWNNYFKSDIGHELPLNIMSLATTPRDNNNSGIGSKPTKNVVVKLAINQLYITLGSSIRIKQEYHLNKIWYAIPLYNNKRRRVTNIKGIIGSSMNHGQIPGFIIYKLLRRDEIKRNLLIKETALDYPRFTDNTLIEKEDVNKIVESITIDE